MVQSFDPAAKTTMPDSEVQHTVEHLFRHESGKMLAVLVRLFGLSRVEIAEDLVQETLLAAFETWKLKGMPDQPRAWLYRAAKNRTIDYLRRERNFRERIAPDVARQMREIQDSDGWLDAFFSDAEIEDAQLRMMFACCCPAIPVEAQLTLMLRTLCGLSIAEIAAAFLLPDDTVAKRLYRAKEKIRLENLTLEAPVGAALTERLDAVLQAVYLLFNEGYKSASAESVIRRDLCIEALRLGELLTRHPVSKVSKTLALQALMCFHAARFDARIDARGDIILLEDQDRSRWHQPLIALGYRHLRESAQGTELCEYHLEAAIASYHASAPTFEKTNWKAIFFCYELLLKINASPFAALNRAIALGYMEHPQAGIDALLELKGLEKNYLYHTALGDFYRKKNAAAEARTSYVLALGMAQLAAEKKVIEEKMNLLSG
jgi:RNA polymerase sigma factor (sigma-70 family)